MRWKEGKKVEQPLVGVYFPGTGNYDFDHDGKYDVCIYKGSSSGCSSSVTTKINIDSRKLRDPKTGSIGGNSGNLLPHDIERHFEEPKDYLYPIPIEDLVLNPNLKQNTGWETEK
jgi:hypothetical protein